jgi:uncharacterized protein (TIGR03435 family)
MEAERPEAVRTNVFYVRASLGIMKSLVAIVALTLVPSGLLLCQPERLRFEVASIKPSPLAPDGAVYGQMQRDPGRVGYSWVTVQTLFSLAYRAKAVQISGPKWFDSDHFDIVAKLPEQEASEEELRSMLQALLEQRFRIAFHMENRNLRAYGLLVAKGGVKAVPIGGEVKDVQTRFNGSRRHLSGKVTMGYLAGLLSNLVDRPVVDLTDLKGVYDVALDWSEDGGAGAPEQTSDLPTLFTALQESLGLRLDNREAPVEVYVIDRAERVPNEN